MKTNGIEAKIKKNKRRCRDKTQSTNVNILKALQEQRERNKAANSNNITSKETVPKNIKGFYYDALLQKYFRIDPTMQKFKSVSSTSESDTSKNVGRKTSLMHYLRNRESGHYQDSSLRMDTIVRTVGKVDVLSSNFYPSNNEELVDLDLNNQQTLVATACNVGIVKIYQTSFNESIRETKKRKLFNTLLWQSPLYRSSISCIRWSLQSNTSNLAIVALGDSAHAGKNICMKAGSLWTMEWNPFLESQLCLGASGHFPSKIIDINGNRTSCVQKHVYSSDVLAQEYLPMGNGIMNGCRNGSIYLWDIRSCSKVRSPLIQMSSSICHMEILKNDCYMMCSDMSGAIHLNDLRVNKAVMQYKGHKNSHYRFRFSMDSNQRILVCGGKDRAIHFWNIQSGAIVHSIDTQDLGVAKSVACFASLPISSNLTPSNSVKPTYPTFGVWATSSKGLSCMTAFPHS